MKIRSRKAFSLTEILVVLIISTIIIGLFTTVFINNWLAYEERISRANLINELNQVIEEMSFVGRNSKLAILSNTPTTKTATLTNSKDLTKIVVFQMSNDGKLIMTQNAKQKELSTHVNFANSNFTLNGPNLIVSLTLQDKVVTRTIQTSTSSEFLPR